MLEALTCGRAVLASDIPGNRALIEDGVTGLLFDSPERLRANTERLVHDPALRARVGRAGRARVEREYPPARELDGYVAVYRDLVEVASA